MLAAAGRPVMLNGADPNWQPAYGGKFLDLPFVVGQQFEGCFNNGGGYRYTERDDAFRKEANGILAVQAHHKSAYCYPTGDTSPEHRLYAYAAWLLVFDPHWSVYEMEVAQPDGHALYPETELVPRDPVRTANTVDDLRDGGTYVREFGACAIGGRAIGACATVVNADSRATAALPRLRRSYGAHVELDARSLFAGGAARVARGVPQSLPPATAAILVAQRVERGDPLRPARDAAVVRCGEIGRARRRERGAQRVRERLRVLGREEARVRAAGLRAAPADRWRRWAARSPPPRAATQAEAFAAARHRERVGRPQQRHDVVGAFHRDDARVRGELLARVEPACRPQSPSRPWWCARARARARRRL